MKYACVPKVRARILSKSAATKSVFVFFSAETFYLKTADFHYPVNNTSSIIVVAVWPEILKAALHQALEKE